MSHSKSVGAPDHYIPLIPHTAYEETHGSLAAGENPVITIGIIAKSLTIYSSQDITVKLNSEDNDAIAIKAHLPYKWDGFVVSTVYIYNTTPVDFYMVYVEGWK